MQHKVAEKCCIRCREGGKTYNWARFDGKMKMKIYSDAAGIIWQEKLLNCRYMLDMLWKRWKTYINGK